MTSIKLPCQFYNCNDSQVGAFCAEHGTTLGIIQKIINMMLAIPFNAEEDIMLLTLKQVAFSSCNKLAEALKSCQKKVSPKQRDNILESANIVSEIS